MGSRIGAHALVCAFVLGSFSPAAQAAVITSVHSTGAGGTSGGTDTNWSIVGPGGSLTAFVTSTTGFPIGTGAWLADNLPTYGWISPQATYLTSPATQDAAGNYAFTTTFDLTGFLPNTALLQFQFAVDNSVTSVVLNSTTFAITGSSITSLSAVQSISSGFVSGLNTITFNVNNAAAGRGANPVGLLVNFTTATATTGTPEPATLGLVGLALVGLGALQFRRARKSAPKDSAADFVLPS